jgi:hypothetical protein
MLLAQLLIGLEVIWRVALTWKPALGLVITLPLVFVLSPFRFCRVPPVKITLSAARGSVVLVPLP